MKSLCSSLHHYFPHLLFLSTSKKGDMCMWTTGGGKKNCTVAFGKASSIQQTAPTHYQVSTIPSSSSLSLSLPLEIDWKKEPTTTISVIFYMGRSVMMGVGNEDTCLLRSCVLCIPCSVMEHVGYLSIKYTLDRRSHLTSLVSCHHTSITFVWRLVSRCVFAAINFVPSRFHVWLLGCVRPAPRQTTNPLRLVFSLRLSLRDYYFLFLSVCVWVLFLSFQSCSGDCTHSKSDDYHR